MTDSLILISMNVPYLQILTSFTRGETASLDPGFLLFPGAFGASQLTLVVKNLPASVGDAGLIPGLGRSPGGGPGNLLQYSCLENPVDRGACRATVSPWGHKESGTAEAT